MDLSGTGMKVAIQGRCSLKVGQCLPLRLKTPQGSVPVNARVIWRKKTGWLKNFEVGFHFVDLKPNLAVALATIARFGFIAGDEVKSAGKPSTGRRTGHPGDGASSTASGHSKCDRPSAVEASLVLAQYYEVLGLTGDASRDQIKSAYRQLARQYHPDVAQGEDNRQKFLRMREAYDLLMEHARKAG